MEQTDRLFKAFIRFVLDALREIADEKDEAQRAAKMDKVLDNLQKTLEDGQNTGDNNERRAIRCLPSANPTKSRSRWLMT